MLAGHQPDLVLISDGRNRVHRNVCEPFARRGIPFAMVLHAASESWWPDEAEINDVTFGFKNAAAVYFVSQGNLQLTRTQFAQDIANAEVVRNPFNVDYDATVPWPRESEAARLAFVDALSPRQRGVTYSWMF